eukprot:6205747-Pleurochrysis_carterae.AAC.1
MRTAERHLGPAYKSDGKSMLHKYKEKANFAETQESMQSRIAARTSRSSCLTAAATARAFFTCCAFFSTIACKEKQGNGWEGL